MSWLITGGSGFIGTNLIALLRASDPGVAIRVLDDLSESSRDDLRAVCAFDEVDTGAPGPGPGEVQLVVADIRDAAALARAARGADVLVHLAACTGVQPSIEDPRMDAETNVLGTLHALLAAREAGCSAFVLASSGAPLGEQDPPIHEQKVPRPLSPYGASKLAGEAYCHAFHGSYGVPTVALRFGNVYGPRSGRKGSVVARFIRRALAGKPLEIYGDGLQTRDFIYIDDLCEAIVAAARADVGGEVFQIATFRETNVVEITEAIAALLRELAGVEVEIVHGDPLPGEIRRNFSDISKARDVLGWTPKTDLDTGLRATIAWFLAGRDAAGATGA